MSSTKLAITGNINSAVATADLGNLTIELHDQNQKVGGFIATANTDKTGKYKFVLNTLTLKRKFQGIVPEVFLVIKKRDRVLMSTMDKQVLALSENMDDVKIILPKDVSQVLVPEKKELPKLDVKNLLKTAGVKTNALSSAEAKLKQAGLLKLESILAKPDRLTTGRTGLDTKTLNKFKAITKFAAAAGSESLGTKLIDEEFLSFSDIGAISKEGLLSRLGTLNQSETAAIETLHAKAQTIRNHTLNQMAYDVRRASRDGKWQDQDSNSNGASNDDNSCVCPPCENVFSPYSYMISLLDMIYHHWDLTTHELEQILLQPINDFDCTKGQECAKQIELAIELLEQHSRVKLPLDDAVFNQDVEKIWEILLFGALSKKNQSPFDKLTTPVTNRMTKFLTLIKNPGVGLANIKKVVEELLRDPKIRDLKSISRRYAKGGPQFEAALGRAYQDIVILYRTALIKSTRKTAEQLQQELFTDLKAGACHKTNRVTFLILALQSFIILARTGKLKKFNRSDINSSLRNKIRNLDAIPVEEASWKWLKDYKNWASAMYMFLYPENVTLPFLGDKFNVAFEVQRDTLLNALSIDQDTIKESYLQMIGSIIDGDLVKLSNHSEESGFYYPELGFTIDLVFFPNGGTPEDFSTARSFIKILSDDSSLEKWINTIDLYMSYLGQDDPLQEEIDLEQRLYFPLMAAWISNRSEDYAAAHDWYRQLYDPTKSGNGRFIFDFYLHFTGNLSLGEDWDNGVLDPEEIANHRKDVMLRHVIIMMVKNLLDWADHEFALATASSLDRARQLYELAQEVLDTPDLADHCQKSIRELTVEIVTRYGLDPGAVAGTIIGTIEDLNLLDDPKIISQAIDDIRKILPEDGTIDPSPIEKVVEKAISNYQGNKRAPKLSDQIETRENEMIKYEDQVLQTPGLQNSVVSPIYFSTSGINIPGLVLGSVAVEEKVFTSPITFCVPPNPVLVALDYYIKLSLLKFQLCLDITGEPLPQVVINDTSVAEFFDTVNAEAERQPLLNLPTNWFNEPPRYRYSYLIEKARQYTNAAQRMGSALLAAYEKFDNEKLAILKAQHAIELASSTIDLRNLGLKDAVTGLELANLQSDRAAAQLDFWQDRIDEGMLSDNEQLGINLMIASGVLHAAAGLIQGVGAIFAGIGGGIAGAGGGGALGSGVATVATGIVGAGAGSVIGGAVAAALPGTVGALGSFAGATSTFGSVALTYASFERRFEDWNFQRDLSDFDLQISEVQKESATNRIDIADQELTISKLQNTQAKEVLSFLENKFSNDHLYEWMIQVLSQNYRTLMQISANVATLAQRALEFERQEKLTIITGDYWSINSTLAYSGNLSDEQKDSGLLGAERLLTDLTRLDAYKLSSEKRRLQMSKTISMAQQLPGELVELKSSGKVTFNTLMNWFDRDFPGHYLRLVKSVKISMLALTSPTDGIHATLSNSGESSVVVKEGLEFKSIRAFRDFGETIALDTPFNETGLFIFNYEDPMFLPFEGLGVETQWVLELPKASNRFNFDTLVDVMLTIEYTSFHDPVYAETVKSQLGNSDSNDIPINCRLQYPDQWYHFKNDPVAADGTRTLNVHFSKQFLPSQYENGQAISTIHVTVMLSGDFSGLSSSKMNELLRSLKIEHEYIENGVTKTLDLVSQSNAPSFKTRLIDSQNSQYVMFSTRENNPSAKLPNGIEPTGDWRISIDEITLPESTTLGERLNDVLLIITTEGVVIRG